MAVKRKPVNSARLKRMEALIRPATESRPDLNQYIFLWGKIKSGKTTFISSGLRPVIFLAEPGHSTVRLMEKVKLVNIDPRGHFIPPRWETALDFKYWLRHADHDHRTVGMDSMSALINLGARFIMRDEEARDDKRRPGTMTQPEWGRLSTIVLDYLEDLEEICAERGMHLILTAHEREPRDEEGENLEGHVVPDMTPKLRRDILKRPAIIARTFIEEDENDEEVLRYGMTFRDPDLLVGERVTPVGAEKPWLPRRAYNVTIPQLVKIIRRKSSGS